MKKKILALALSLAMAVTMLPATSVRAEGSEPADASREVVSSDVGLDATVSESAISSWEEPNKINVEWEPTQSGGAGKNELNGSWGNYNCQPDADGHWVAYDWTDAVTTSSMQIYWYDDGGGLRVPADLKIQYIDLADIGSDTVTWKDVNMTTDYSTAKNLNQYNVINFEEITAVSIRLLMTREGGAWMGIHRWKVMGSHQTLTEEQVAALDTSVDKAKLTLPSQVRGDFQLPAQTASGKDISWESSNLDVITVDESGSTAKIGEVSGEAEVTMTAKVDGAVFKTFTVKVLLPFNLRDAEIILNNNGVYEYSGAEISPYIERVVYGDKVLGYGVDWYPIMPQGAVNVDTYEIGITSEGTTGGEYTGSKMQPFTIAPKALKDENITLDQEEYTYTEGTAAEPAVTVKVMLGEQEVTLVKDTDYTVSYSGNTTPGTGTVIVEGKGNYGGKIQRSFSIVEEGKTNIKDAVIMLEKDAYLETVEAIEPNVTSVVLGETALTKDTDYTVSYMNNTAPGTATVVITGNGNYTGSVSKTFTILKDLNKAEIALNENGIYEYTGSAISPTIVTVMYNGEEARWNVHWLPIMPQGAVNPGTYQIGITSEGLSDNPYGGSKTIDFKVVKTLKDADVTLVQTEYSYEGTKIEPDVTVKVTIKDEDGTTDVEKTLVKDTDYTVEYKDNNIEGTATVTVKGIGFYAGTVNKTFTITEGSGSNKPDMSTLAVTFPDDGEYEYTGAEIKPTVTVKDGDTPLSSETGFNVVYPDDATNVGVKTITINPGTDGAYKGSKTATYEIKARTLTQDNTEITLTMPDNVAAGAQIKPQVAVKVTIADGNVKTLTANTDYTVEYGDNNTPGTDAGSVTITGKGNYKGSVEKKFDIAGDTPPDDNKIDMSTLSVTFTDGGEYEYTGADIQPMAEVKDGDTSLRYGEDFIVEYPAEGAMTSVGEKTVTLKPGSNGKYKNSKSASYEIKARMLTKDNTEITLTQSEAQANPTVSVKVTVANYDNLWYQEGEAAITNVLTEGTDFTVEYGTGDKAGTVTITGMVNYTGSVEKAPGQTGPVETKTDLKEAVVTIPDCTYNKNAQKPAVTVKVDNKTLVEGTDYTVSYENNTNAGTAKAVITAKEGSDYTGSTEQNFTINKANAVITASNITKTIGEKDFGFGAKVDSNGTLSYTSNKTKVIKVVKGKAQIVGAGTANITIKAAATANYNEATKTITIKVNKLKKATLSKVESKKSGQLKVTWKKDAKAAGYKVMYSTDKKFKNKKVTKTITVNKNKTVSKTIKKLKKGKKYYVKVCSYVKVGKKEVLGSYSKAKSVKVKK